jgi:glycerophosphoryl diester phosphodiesterase
MVDAASDRLLIARYLFPLMPPVTSYPPFAIAHRGAHQDLPENSLPAILRALDLGAQGVEIDVHATSDGVLVLHHDPGLADGRAIASLTANEIAGAHLAPGVPIALLEEALEAVAGRAVLFIETKVANVEFPIIRCVRRSRAESAVHSFHHDTIRNLKQTMPAMRAGVLTEGNGDSAVRAAVAARADDVWHATDDVDAKLVAACHRLGKSVIAWTANSLAECNRLESLGVDGICTDDLALVAALPR